MPDTISDTDSHPEKDEEAEQVLKTIPSSDLDEFERIAGDLNRSLGYE